MMRKERPAWAIDEKLLSGKCAANKMHLAVTESGELRAVTVILERDDGPVLFAPIADKREVQEMAAELLQLAGMLWPDA